MMEPLKEIHEILRKRMRKKWGLNESTNIYTIDSQSIKTTKIGSDAREFDGGKNTKGRKWHIVTDTQGFLLAVEIHAANEHDSKAGLEVIRQANTKSDRMRKVYADGGLSGRIGGKSCQRTRLGDGNYITF